MDDTLYDGTGLAPEGDAQQQLTAAVYGTFDGAPADDRTPSEVEADKNAEGNSGDIASGAYVEGTTVESDTAGTGGAVNAETGEITQPGEPLPPIEGGDGQPLEPPTDTHTDAEQPEQPTP